MLTNVSAGRARAAAPPAAARARRGRCSVPLTATTTKPFDMTRAAAAMLSKRIVPHMRVRCCAYC